MSEQADSVGGNSILEKVVGPPLRQKVPKGRFYAAKTFASTSILHLKKDPEISKPYVFGGGETLFQNLVFDLFPGPWQAPQIPTAKQAIAFWRSIIHEYTHGNYSEDQTNDPHWGIVIRQLFHARIQVASKEERGEHDR